MSFFGARRTRQTRVFRPTPTIWEKLSAALQDYRVLTLLLVALLAVILLQIALQSWRARFPYRESQIASSGVLARVDFKIENALATRQAQAEAEENSPPVFIQQNEVLEELRAAFRSGLSAIANTENLAEVPAEVSDAFQLSTPIKGDVEKGTADTTRFAQVRLSMTESSMSVAERVELMCQDFNVLLKGIEEIGVLNASEIPDLELSEEDLEPQRRVEVTTPPDVPGRDDPVVMADIRLEDQLLKTGRIGGKWADLANLQQIRKAVESWLRNSVRGQMKYDTAATEQRRSDAIARVKTQYDSFAAGRILVEAGTQIEGEHLKVLGEEYAQHEMDVSFTRRLQRVAGWTLLLTLLVVMFGAYLVRFEKELLEEVGQLLTFVLICSGAVFLSCTFSRDPWRAEIVPLLAAVTVIAIVYNQSLAILTAFSLSLLISTATVANLGHFAVLMALCITVVAPLQSVSSRSTLIKVGFFAAIIGFVGVWSVNLISGQDYGQHWKNVPMLVVGLKFAAWSLVCCYIVAGSLPFIEKGFGIVTDISLLELTDVSHPLLQELAQRAPGTYNHSISVATIGEAAADAIGANGLLLRVGAYFHDVGKMLKPEYFIENMVDGQENPHDNLAPAMSALIIIGHVKDGAELAEQHNLPRKLVDFIEQHHGTTLVEYFFREAANRADEDHRTDADESTFRYPGPRPLTKETGVMMLADAVESASRTLSEPTPKRIQSLVQDITLKRVLDGQFDECGLTMSEIRVVQESLVKSLLAVHHGRVKYPDQKTAS